MPKRGANEQNEDDGAPSVSPSKKRRLLEAAKEDDVETLKQLLDSPKNYKIYNKDGHNLLHISVLRESDEVFHYLLSLDDFPIDAVTVNRRPHTALQLALGRMLDNNCNIDYHESCAIELIKRGANIDIECDDGASPLHIAVEYASLKLARLLIERGADVNMLNSRSYLTPLQVVNIFEDTMPEIVTMLLCNGADPLVRNTFDETIFDDLIVSVGFCRGGDEHIALENLFYFTVEWSSYPVYVEGLLNCAKSKSPLFHQIIKLTSESSEIIFGDDISRYCLDLFTIDSEYLLILLEKYPNVVKVCLQSYSVNLNSYKWFRIENSDILLQSSLREDTLELISKLNASTFITFAQYSETDIDEIFELLYYLLSYGMVLNWRDLDNIYELTGYNEDFKNLLFMDIQTDKNAPLKNKNTIPRLLYDIMLDIHKIVETPSRCRRMDWEQLLHYFVHPKIQNAFRRLKPYEASKRKLPQLPLLKELARDTFRKYFITRLEITTPRRFYTLLKILPIDKHVEKIITYETKLY